MRANFQLFLMILIFLIGCSKQQDELVDLEKIKEESFKQGKKRGYELFKKELESKTKFFEKELKKEYERGYSIGYNKALNISKITNLAFRKELVKKHIFFIKYYEDFYRNDKSRANTLVTNFLDTAYYVGENISNRHASREVDKQIQTVLRNNKDSDKNIENSAFIFDQIIKVNDRLQVSQFIDFFGHEYISYVFCKTDTMADYYIFNKFYNRLDGTSIGGISHEKILDLGNDEFAFIDRKYGEEHDGISIHYFSKNLKNVHKEIIRYNPGLEIVKKRMKYSISENDSILTVIISKRVDDIFKNTSEEEWQWEIETQEAFNIFKIIGQLKNSLDLNIQ